MKLSLFMLVSVNEAFVKHISVIIFQLAKHVFAFNAYVMYVASYIMKTDRAMGQLLKRVASEARTDELKQQLRKVGSTFLTHREVSAQEAVYRILSLPMKQLSRSVVFVDTNTKSERIAVLHCIH